MKEELSVIYSDDNIKGKYDVSIASLGDVYKSMNQSKDSIINKKNRCIGSESPHLKKEQKLKELLKDPDPELIEKPDYSYNSDDQDVSRLINKSVYEKIKVDEYRNEMQHLNQEKSKQPHIDNLFIDMAHQLPENNTQINVKYLKYSNNINNKKYSHIKSGKINPVKSSYSIKPIIDDNIKKHQDALKEFVLEADRVEINITEVKKIKSPRNFITKYQKADDFEIKDDNKRNIHRNEDDNIENFKNNDNLNQKNYVVIGEGFNPQKNQNVNNIKARNNPVRPKSSLIRNNSLNYKNKQTDKFNRNKNINKDLDNYLDNKEIDTNIQDNNTNFDQTANSGGFNNRAQKFDDNENNRNNRFNNSNQQSILYYENNYGKTSNKSNVQTKKPLENRPSSKENRTLLKKVEEFYANTKNLLTSSDNNLPARVNLNQLVKSSEIIEKSLVDFHQNLVEPQFNSNNSSIMSKNIDTGRPKSSNYMLKNSINKYKKREAKNFKIDLNPEERKKFEEKLELLHVEMRSTLDNLNQVNNSSEKFYELTKRWHELTQNIRSLSKLTGGSFKSNSNFENEFQEMDNLSNNDFYISEQQNNQNQNFQENLNRTNNTFNDNINNNYSNNRGDEQELLNYSNKDFNNNQIANNLKMNNNQFISQENLEMNNIPNKTQNVVNNYSKESIPIYNEVDEVINVLNTQKNRSSLNFPQTHSNQSNTQRTINDKKLSSNYSMHEGNNKNNTVYNSSKGRFFDPQTMKNFEFSMTKNQDSRFGNTSSNRFYTQSSNFNKLNDNNNNNIDNNNNNIEMTETNQNFSNTQRNFTNYNSTQNNYCSPINHQPKNDIYSINSVNNNYFKSTEAKTNNFSSGPNYNLSENNSKTNFVDSATNFKNIQKNTDNISNTQNNIINQDESNFQNNNNINYNNTFQQNQNLTKEEEERMKIMKEYQDKFIINKSGALFDERFTSYDIKMPLDYYHSYAKANEPPKERDWCIRPHHTESIIKNKEVIPDDIMNTKYISYYAEAEKPEPPPTRLHLLNEVIGGLQGNIDMLKKKLHQKAVTDKEFRNVYKKLINLKEEAKNEFVPGKLFEKLEIKSPKSTDMLTKNTGKNYSEFFNQNEEIGNTNYIIKTYETLLGELRNLEKEKILKKRKEEYEKIRPPKEKWWEMKSKNFQSEFKRNTVVLNSGPEYFKKLQLLQSKNLY